MPQIRTASISSAGKDKNLSNQCFLSGNHIPDYFAIEAENQSHVEYAWETALIRQTVCLAVFDSFSAADDMDSPARLAAEMLKEEVSRLSSLPLPLVEAFMQRYVSRVNNRILQYASNDPVSDRFGATFIIMCLRGDQAVLFRIGQCQATLCSRYTINPLKWKSAADGALSTRPADYLGQPVGDGSVVFETTGILSLEDHDTFLLSTGNLEKSIAEKLAKASFTGKNPKEAVDMMKGTFDQSGSENITITAVSWTTAEKKPAPHFTTADDEEMPKPRKERPKDYQVPEIQPEKREIKIEKMTVRHLWASLPSWLWIITILAVLVLLVLLGFLIASK